MFNFSRITLQTVFRFDALGALGSFFVNGLVLPRFTSYLGIEPWMLHGLAGLAFFFMLFGLLVSFKVLNIREWMLKTLIFINLSYCFLTASLILLLPSLTRFGVMALLIEIFVIFAVVGFELQVLRNLKRPRGT